MNREKIKSRHERSSLEEKTEKEGELKKLTTTRRKDENSSRHCS